jgi:hypothetical protein
MASKLSEPTGVSFACAEEGGCAEGRTARVASKVAVAVALEDILHRILRNDLQGAIAAIRFLTETTISPCCHDAQTAEVAIDTIRSLGKAHLAIYLKEPMSDRAVFVIRHAIEQWKTCN